MLFLLSLGKAALYRACGCLNEVQSSLAILGTHTRLVPEHPLDTKIHGCASPYINGVIFAYDLHTSSHIFKIIFPLLIIPNTMEMLCKYIVAMRCMANSSLAFGNFLKKFLVVF